MSKSLNRYIKPGTIVRVKEGRKSSDGFKFITNDILAKVITCTNYGNYCGRYRVKIEVMKGKIKNHWGDNSSTANVFTDCLIESNAFHNGMYPID